MSTEQRWRTEGSFPGVAAVTTRTLLLSPPHRGGNRPREGSFFPKVTLLTGNHGEESQLTPGPGCLRPFSVASTKALGRPRQCCRRGPGATSAQGRPEGQAKETRRCYLAMDQARFRSLLQPFGKRPGHLWEAPPLGTAPSTGTVEAVWGRVGPQRTAFAWRWAPGLIGHWGSHTGASALPKQVTLSTVLVGGHPPQEQAQQSGHPCSPTFSTCSLETPRAVVSSVF